MSRHMDVFKEEFEAFIKYNQLAEIVSSFDFSNEPKGVIGKVLYQGNDFYRELERRIEKAESGQTLGEYLEFLYQKRKKEHPEWINQDIYDRFYKSKIVNGVVKNPSKRKLLPLAVSLHLDLEETEKLLRKAGLTLSEEISVFDSIIGFFILNNNYDYIKIDEELINHNETPVFSIA